MIIRISNLRANGVLGVYKKERVVARPIVVNLAVEIDGTAVASTDVGLRPLPCHSCRPGAAPPCEGHQSC